MLVSELKKDVEMFFVLEAIGGGELPQLLVAEGVVEEDAEFVAGEDVVEDLCLVFAEPVFGCGAGTGEGDVVLVLKDFDFGEQGVE